MRRLTGTVIYDIELSRGSVYVDAFSGTVSPDESISATAYRHEGEAVREADDEKGSMSLVMVRLDGTVSTVPAAGITAASCASLATAEFQYKIDGVIKARKALQINRSGKTYQPLRVREWSTVPDLSRLYPGCDPDDEWTDIVYTSDSSGNQRYYKCISACSKASGTLPSESIYSGKLIAASSYEVIATAVLLANNAVIRLMQGNSVIVTDSEGNASGGLTGDRTGVQLWIGDADKGNAPFRVMYDGSLYSSSAYISGRIEASVLELTVDTSGDGGIPDGAICFNKSTITLPELERGSVRTIKILNPFMTRTSPQPLKLVPQNGNVYISTDSLSYIEATSETMTLPDKGNNGGSYFELLGINVSGLHTVWLLREM